jgi:hypothetical protein
MMRVLLRDKLLEVLGAIAPLIAVVAALQITLVRAPIAMFLQFLVGSAKDPARLRRNHSE